MASLYHSLFTEKGLELLRTAIQSGTKLGITHMSFGDGNGVLPVPDAKFTKMVKEVYRVQLNRLAASKENANWLEADGVIPSAVGGFNIREVGLWAGNVMVAYANYPPTYKPTGDQGTAQIKTIRIVLQIDNTANFELKIDASVVMATIQAVEDAKQDAIKYADETKIQHVESLEELLTIEAWPNRTIFLKSYWPNLNKGGGLFKYDLNKKDINDSGTIFYGWVRLNIDYVTPEMFGAIGYDNLNENSSIIGLFNSYDALQKAFKHPEPLQLGNCSYLHSKPLIVNRNKKVSGGGRDITKLLKTTHQSSGLPTIAKPGDGKLVNYDVDASIIAYDENGDYVNGTTLTGFRTSYVGDAHKQNHDEYIGYGIYAPLSSESVFKDVKCLGYEFPFYTINSWLILLERVHAHGLNGFTIGGTTNENSIANTTTTLTNCWSTATGKDRYAYNINKIWQCVLNSCAAESIGQQNNAAQGIFQIKESFVIISGLDIEQAHIKQFIKSSESTVSINSVNSYELYVNYADKNTYLYDIEWGRCEVRNVSLNFLDVDSLKTSNFAKLYGNVDFSYKTSFTATEISDQVGQEYIPKPNDFVVLAAENSFYDIDGRNGKAYTNRYLKSKGRIETPIFNTNVSLKDLRKTQTKYAFVTSDIEDTPTKDGLGVIFNLSSANPLSSDDNNSLQLFFPLYGGNLDAMFRTGYWGGSGFREWIKFRTTANTTVTADGTLKAASPIVKLYSDHIECNDEAEEQSPLFEKLGTGHYLVKNTLGFAQEGWWIEVPSDSNGNKICAIQYQTLENGDIEVKTLKRKFDVETASIIADEENPIDIPENMNGEQRWIDIRLHKINKEITEQVNL